MIKKKGKQSFIQELYSRIAHSAKGKNKNSYTKFLLNKGRKKIAEKVSEESKELVFDYLKGSKKRVIEETADLIYHVVLLLYSKKVTIKDIETELKKRSKPKNVRQK